MLFVRYHVNVHPVDVPVAHLWREVLFHLEDVLSVSRVALLSGDHDAAVGQRDQVIAASAGEVNLRPVKWKTGSYRVSTVACCFLQSYVPSWQDAQLQLRYHDRPLWDPLSVVHFESSFFALGHALLVLGVATAHALLPAGTDQGAWKRNEQINALIVHPLFSCFLTHWADVRFHELFGCCVDPGHRGGSTSPQGGQHDRRRIEGWARNTDNTKVAKLS